MRSSLHFWFAFINHNLLIFGACYFANKASGMQAALCVGTALVALTYSNPTLQHLKKERDSVRLER